MSHDVFISYSTHDKAVADATCAFLEAAGIRCWIAPRDIAPGAEWGEAIIDAIHGSRVMVLVFSENANNSPQIRREVERAVNKGVTVIPFRIQDIAPAHALEYFIGSVHWLDAITPPMEGHLRRLAESVKGLLQVDRAPPVLGRPTVVAPPTALVRPKGPDQKMIVGAGLGATAVAIVAWLLLGGRGAAPIRPATPVTDSVAVSPVNPDAVQPGGRTRAQMKSGAPAPAESKVDPAVIGTFEHRAVIDDYSWRFDYTIRRDGTYNLVTTQEEQGTYQAGKGSYRTVGTKTGRVRTGTYWAVGDTGIDVKGPNGTALYMPEDRAFPINPLNPNMLGRWHATVVQGGVTWTLTLQNNSNGTYSYQALTDDSGTCTYANQQWQATSAITGLSDMGSYRVVDATHVEFTDPNGPIVWHRQ